MKTKCKRMTAIAQFLGFLLFLCITVAGFWCLSFLIFMVPYWITVGAGEMYGKINKDVYPDTVRKKPLTEQEDVTVVWKKTPKYDS
ncbi:MAG: hypothetical protein ACMUEM_05740 [Flavobacteriales bacterium AspAUS03]